MPKVKSSSVTRHEKKERARCRKWRIRVITDMGEVVRILNGVTYNQAREALAELIAEVEARPDSSSTFKAYAARWHEYRKNIGNVARRTVAKEGYAINALNHHLADRDLTKITPGSIRDMYVSLKKGNSPSGRPLSGTYLNLIHGVLKQILDSAVSEKLLPSNPCDSIKAPKIDTQEKQALTASQANEVLTLLDEEGINAHVIAVRLALSLGMRRSEICAAKWSDYTGEVMSVREAAEEDGSTKGTKTEKSTRHIPVSKAARDTLDEWYKIQARELARLGIPQTESTRIVTTEDGTEMTPPNLDRWWRRNRKHFGLEGFGLHELRHTFVTLLVHSGANLKDVQEIVGHAKIDILLRIYTHSNKNQQRIAIDKLEEYLAVN